MSFLVQRSAVFFAKGIVVGSSTFASFGEVSELVDMEAVVAVSFQTADVGDYISGRDDVLLLEADDAVNSRIIIRIKDADCISCGREIIVSGAGS